MARKTYLCITADDTTPASGPSDPTCSGLIREVTPANSATVVKVTQDQLKGDDDETRWDDYPLFRTMTEDQYRMSGSAAMGGTGFKDQLFETTAADYINYPYEIQATEKFERLAKTLDKAGFKNDGTTPSVARKWGEALVAMSNWGIRMEPEDGLLLLANYRELTGMNAGSGGGGGTTTTVTLTNEFDAEALVDSALNTYLGRDATEAEIDTFYKKLNAKERKNPRVTTRSGKSSTTSGGINTQLEAEKFAETREDYADVQAQTTFKGLIEQAVRSRMSGDLL